MQEISFENKESKKDEFNEPSEGNFTDRNSNASLFLDE
jgi:hypothetical protein